MLQRLYSRYNDELKRIKDDLREALYLFPVNEELGKILSEITDNPGKLIRPIIMLAAAGEYDDRCRQELLATATSMELIHNSSLILDDMLDETLTRRGRPTVVARYGTSVTLCVGEFILAASNRYLQNLGYHAGALEVEEVTQRACNGEMIQNLNRKNTEVTKDSYLKAISGKTAALFRVMCESAGRITQKDEETRKTMGDLGETVGIMFQIRDDLLDWTTDEEILGKPVNQDFAEGIYTLPAIYAFRDPVIGAELREMAGKDKLSSGEMMEVRKLVIKAGGTEYTWDYIRTLGAKGREYLSALPDKADREALEEIITALQQQP